MQCPEAWLVLSETLWQLPAAEARMFWEALRRARYTRAVVFRQDIMLLGYMRLDVAHFIERRCTPAAVVHVIEALIHERQLRRKQGNRLEEYILAQVDAHGCWQGNSWHGEVCESSLAPDVIRLADIGKL